MCEHPGAQDKEQGTKKPDLPACEEILAEKIEEENARIKDQEGNQVVHEVYGPRIFDPESPLDPPEEQLKRGAIVPVVVGKDLFIILVIVTTLPYSAIPRQATVPPVPTARPLCHTSR